MRWYGESRLFGFGVSPSAAVIDGRDGWFFYADDKAVEDYANVELLDDAAIANWREAVVRARNWLQARRIGYVFTIAPDKHVIYGEEMSLRPSPRIRDTSRADQLFVALQDTGLAVDVRPALFEAKARERIYQKTDTHWNDRGALIAYQQIIDAVRARVPSTPPAWTRHDFEAVERTAEGDGSRGDDGADARAARDRSGAGADAAAPGARRRAGRRARRRTKKAGWSPRSTTRRCRAR